MSLKGKARVSEDMAKLIQQKTEVENDLLSVERQIYALETSYLKETAAIGNVLRGWNGLLSSGRHSSRGGQGGEHIQSLERLFSLSSATAMEVRVSIQICVDKCSCIAKGIHAVG